MGFLFFGRKKNKKEKNIETKPAVETEVKKDIPEKGKTETKTKVNTTKKTTAKKQTSTPKKVAKEEKISPKAEKKEVEEKKATRAPSSKKVYHVSLRKDDGKWQVKYGGGAKAIKLFDTQAEAIKFAEERADSQEGSISIHKKDGKIRKQDYSKKTEDK